MITHMVKATVKAYIGMKFADSWMVHHNALSIMTAKESQACMKTQFIDVDTPDNEKVSYFDRLILPEMELNDEFVYFKGKPVGNSPEMMPLDNCLNKDIHESVSRHVLMSRASGGSLNKDDVRFFSLATPKNAAHAYRRIWDPTTGVAPPSKRIIQDINKVQDAMVQIHKQKGAFVPNLAQRPGDRHIINQLKSEIWGGKRTKMETLKLFAAMENLHADLKGILEDDRKATEAAAVAASAASAAEGPAAAAPAAPAAAAAPAAERPAAAAAAEAPAAAVSLAPAVAAPVAPAAVAAAAPAAAALANVVTFRSAKEC